MSAIGGAVGGVVGAFAGQGDKNSEEAARRAAYGATNYNTKAASQQRSEFGAMDPTARNAMLQAMTDYQSKAAQGGLDAAGRARLAQGVAGGEQAAARSAQQIQNQAARAGTAQGPAAMVAQQVAAQQGAERAQQGGLQGAALAEQAQRQAMEGGLGAARGVSALDVQKAQAQDAINKFNVQNAQQNIGNAAQQAGQKIGVKSGEAQMYGDRSKATQAQFAGIGSGIGGIASMGLDSFMGGGGGGGGGGGLKLAPSNTSGSYMAQEGYEDR